MKTERFYNAYLVLGRFTCLRPIVTLIRLYRRIIMQHNLCSILSGCTIKKWSINFRTKYITECNFIKKQEQSRQYSVSFQNPSVFKNCSIESPKVGSPRPLFPTIFGALPSIAAGDAPRLYIQTKSCTSEFPLFEPISSFANTSDYEKLSYEFC